MLRFYEGYCWGGPYDGKWVTQDKAIFYCVTHTPLSYKLNEPEEEVNVHVKQHYYVFKFGVWLYKGEVNGKD